MPVIDRMITAKHDLRNEQLYFALKLEEKVQLEKAFPFNFNRNFHFD